MNKLWKFNWDLCYGHLWGLFLATDEEILNLIGKEVYFGEENGKHSEVTGTIEKDDIELFSDDEYVIAHIKPFGYNPLEYWGENNG